MMNLKKAEKVAYSLLEEHAVSQPEVPIEKIIKDLKINLVYEPLDADISGFLFRDETTGKSIICVNENHTTNRKRFTIAHELGHFLLHNGSEDTHIDRGFTINFRNSISSQAINKREIEANAFAAALLMPEELLIPAVLEKLENGVDIVDESGLKDIAKKFKVSEHALCIRLGKLGYL